jgi:RNA polymerase sigma-70 factor (ECF subfamily)
VLNIKEFDSFFKENEKRFYKKIYFLVKDEDVALDILQDSMIKLMENYSSKDKDEWPLLFHTIVSNCVNDYFRKKNNQTIQYMSDFSGGIEDEEQFLDSISSEHIEDSQFNLKYSKEIIVILQDALETLPLRQKEAFLLRYLDELSITETAEVMKCSEGSVKTHCSRACIALADFLKKKGINK